MCVCVCLFCDVCVRVRGRKGVCVRVGERKGLCVSVGERKGVCVSVFCCVRKGIASQAEE